MAFAITLLGWAFLHAWLVTLFGFRWSIALQDSFFSNLVLVLLCLLIANTLRYYLPEQNRYIYLTALNSFAAFVWLGVSTFLLLAFVSPGYGYSDFYMSSIPVRAAFGFLLLGAVLLMNVLWYSVQQQEVTNQRNAEAQKLTTDAELYRLREQLKPHFLFNSLNSIQALIGQDPRKARTMVHQLSDFLRSTIRGDEKQWISLQQELDILYLYLDIEKVRFGHRLQTHIEIAEGAANMQIPALLLQPIVENAIKFGLYDTLDAVEIGITAIIEGKQLVVQVSNPFDSNTAITKKGTGFGLSSVQRRLHLVFNRTDLLTTSQKDQIYTTTIKIPQLA